MKLKLLLLPVLVLGFALPVMADDPASVLRRFIETTYGKQLDISPEQIEQLTWVMANSIATPEMATRDDPVTIHREIPRALSRLYTLQLLRSGSKADYQQFIAPQKDRDRPRLKYDSFSQMAKLIASIDTASYEVLQAAAIISAVTLSPMARKRATQVIAKKLPEDSTRFLSVTAPYASQVYPLAYHVARKYPGTSHKFEIIFLPDSHLRHMIYNEGSQAMYSTMKKGMAEVMCPTK